MKKKIEEVKDYRDDPEFEELLKLEKVSTEIQCEPHFYTVQVLCEVRVDYSVCSNGKAEIEAEIEETEDALTETENLPEVIKTLEQLEKLEAEIQKLANKIAKEYNEDEDDIINVAEEIIGMVLDKYADWKRYKKQYKKVFGK